MRKSSTRRLRSLHAREEKDVKRSVQEKAQGGGKKGKCEVERGCQRAIVVFGCPQPQVITQAGFRRDSHFAFVSSFNAEAATMGRGGGKERREEGG
jgi:hypothetical protein